MSDKTDERDRTGGGAPATASTSPDTSSDLDGDVIPRLKRGKGIRLNSTDLFRIAAVAILLVGLVMLQRPCADGVAQFVTSVGGVDAGPAAESDGGPDLGELRMLTDEEIRDVFNDKGVDKLLERDADAAP